MADLTFQTFGLAKFDVASRTVSGLAVPYNAPTRPEHKLKLAFAVGSIKYPERVKLTVNHDANSVIGSSPDTMQLNAGTQGITASATIPETTLGRDTIKLLEAGVLKGFSVETNIDKSSIQRHGDMLIAHNAHMHTVSIVTSPAFVNTEVELFSFFDTLPDLGEIKEPAERRKGLWIFG